MQVKNKLLIYYLSELFLSIFLLLLFLITTLKVSVFNKNYFLRQLEKNNYYEKLSENIDSDMKNYILQSGLDESVFENIYTEEMLKEDVRNSVKSFYSGNSIDINTDNIKIKLTENIDAYIKENHLTVSKQEDLDSFVTQILNVYKEKVTLSQILNKVSKPFVKIERMLNITLIVVLILFIAIFVVAKKICKKLLFPIPCFTTALLVFLGNFLLFKQISVRHISFWNTYVSEIIQRIILNFSLLTKVCSVGLIILAIGIIAMKRLVKPKIKVKQ